MSGTDIKSPFPECLLPSNEEETTHHKIGGAIQKKERCITSYAIAGSTRHRNRKLNLPSLTSTHALGLSVICSSS